MFVLATFCFFSGSVLLWLGSGLFSFLMDVWLVLTICRRGRSSLRRYVHATAVHSTYLVCNHIDKRSKINLIGLTISGVFLLQLQGVSDKSLY
ncbi:uncharacterized protein BO96DRAFT_240348 [Aspergillus niger CBS 101883]|uniref:uncharacterized protein n=1 Tax=Aspergillus lacticoffeatus (strain CBS 101883) TaxID=1450533 RepID=UPI000D7F6E5A|nr:uncharacterized protein BO96DRAFT_240348 [Aspergillus niger CBS 101883]PYH58413.1 hypothetical protein BO96DRAFT_240348 [Aspergillus niger CBS 101883]